MIRRASTVLLTLMMMIAAAASARAGAQEWGPQVGFSSGPDQVVFGGHLAFRDVAPSIDFVPSLDIGIGDHETVFSVNGDFHYRFDVRSRWQPYAGAGVGLHFVSFDNDFGGGSDSFGGGSIIVGADVPTNRGSHFYVEGRFGLGDSPDFKALAGWNFAMR
jgi:hypothetical protein